MSGYRDDDQLNQDEFSLEAILAEFGSGTPQRQEEPPAAGFDAPAEGPSSEVSGEDRVGRDAPGAPYGGVGKNTDGPAEYCSAGDWQCNRADSEDR